MARVTEIRFVGYGVPDLATERAFHNDQWKLVETGEKDTMVHFAAEGSEELTVVRLRQNDDKRIDVIALAADSRADVDTLHEKVAASGCKIIFAPKELTSLGGGYGFRFFSPDGLPFEISSDVARREARPLSRWEGVPVKGRSLLSSSATASIAPRNCSTGRAFLQNWRAGAFRRSASTSPDRAKRCAFRTCRSIRTAKAGRARRSTGWNSSRRLTRRASA